MLIYEQEISIAAGVLGGLIGYGSVWCDCSAWVRIQFQTERFCEGMLLCKYIDNITKYIYIYIYVYYQFINARRKKNFCG